MIIPNLTFAATINAVINVGATAVVVDVEEDSPTICPLEIVKSITTRTKAVICVNLLGLNCDLQKIKKICNQFNLFLIEDCAESLGSSIGKNFSGSFGIINTFSLFANKIISTGEGGMCITNSMRLKNRLETIKNHGMSKTKKYWHTEVGRNFRMTNIQAAIMWPAQKL